MYFSVLSNIPLHKYTVPGWFVLLIGTWGFCFSGQELLMVNLSQQFDKEGFSLSKDEVEDIWSSRVGELIWKKKWTSEATIVSSYTKKAQRLQDLLTLGFCMTPPSSFIQDFAHLAHLNSNGASWQTEWQLSVDSKTQTKGGCSVIWSTQQNPWEAKGKRGSKWGPWRMRGWGKSPREQSAHHVSRWEACTLVHQQAREAFHQVKHDWGAGWHFVRH